MYISGARLQTRRWCQNPITSYVRETFYATASQTQFNVVTNFSASDRVNVYLNGTRLSEIDYTLDDINNKVIFASGLSADDVVSIEIFVSGFRSSNHNSRGEKALHPVFAAVRTVEEMMCREGIMPVDSSP